MITDMWPMLFVRSYGHRKIGRTCNACWLVGWLVGWSGGEFVALRENERTLGMGIGVK